MQFCLYIHCVFHIHVSRIMEPKHVLFILIIFMLVCNAQSIEEPDLLLSYNKTIISNSSRTITVEFFLQQVNDFDPDSGMLLSGILVLEWVDDRLSWNDSYRKSETTGMLIDINKIWIPSLDLSNSMGGLRLDGQSEKQINEEAYVNMDGHVTWKTRVFLDPYCPSDNTRSNKQSCYLSLVAANIKANKFDFNLNLNQLDLKAYIQNYNWKLCGTKSNMTKDAFGNDAVIFKMWFRRNLSVEGAVDYVSRITLVTLIAGTSVCVFKIPADSGRIELISIILIVTNIFDPNTLQTAYQKSIYNIIVFVFVLLDMSLIIIVLRVVIIPYEGILSCPGIRAISSICCSSGKKTTKKTYSLKERGRLPTVRQARNSHHEINEVIEETDATSADRVSLNENQETNKSTQEDELAEDAIYDSRNFKLFIFIYLLVYLGGFVICVRNDIITANCESDIFE